MDGDARWPTLDGSCWLAGWLAVGRFETLIRFWGAERVYDIRHTRGSCDGPTALLQTCPEARRGKRLLCHRPRRPLVARPPQRPVHFTCTTAPTDDEACALSKPSRTLRLPRSPCSNFAAGSLPFPPGANLLVAACPNPMRHYFIFPLQRLGRRCLLRTCRAVVPGSSCCQLPAPLPSCSCANCSPPLHTTQPPTKHIFTDHDFPSSSTSYRGCSTGLQHACCCSVRCPPIMT
ncbi:hypothetical protein CERZMDRAFT_86154 [Cercospora zeae-maydis SCOH1-5]|uniref:Uncharacterized protein n=1 Tax=Cercospora zeae-maydis SCOH1-5 TaxID=717836 RepID=A0A6A6FAJ3_9PEZI|nr:hypothetical protein CERZMDRAFT_86154 [Cercospora zeae-maydis SCOH1-5]